MLQLELQLLLARLLGSSPSQPTPRIDDQALTITEVIHMTSRNTTSVNENNDDNGKVCWASQPKLATNTLLTMLAHMQYT